MQSLCTQTQQIHPGKNKDRWIELYWYMQNSVTWQYRRVRKTGATHKHTHTHIHTRACAHTHMHTHAHRGTLYTHIHPPTHTAQTHTHTHTHTYTQENHTQTHTHTHAHTHTHFFCLYSSCVRAGMPQFVLVVAVILKCSTILAVISEYSIVSVIFPLTSLWSSFLSVLALGPTVILRVYSCLDLGLETGRLQHV